MKYFVVAILCCLSVSVSYAANDTVVNKWPCPVLCSNGKYALLGKDGTMIITCKDGYHDIRNYSEGYAVFSRGGILWGYLDALGNVVIPEIYRTAYSFNEGTAVVNMGNDHEDIFAYINKSGETVISGGYDDAYTFQRRIGLTVVSMKGRRGFIDNTGKVVIPFKYREAAPFSEGLAAVTFENDQTGYIDRVGTVVIEPRFIWGASFSEGLALIEDEEGYGFIDKTGVTVIEPQFDWASSFVDGFAAVEIDGKQCFINKIGKITIPCRYDNVSVFSNGFAVVKKNGKYGYINKLGREVVSCIYDGAQPFSEGYAVVYKNYKFGLINKNGKEVVPCIYDDAMEVRNGLMAVLQDDVWKVISVK